jgi:hypothetical protein
LSVFWLRPLRVLPDKTAVSGQETVYTKLLTPSTLYSNLEVVVFYKPSLSLIS